jgi:hypothetical protein
MATKGATQHKAKKPLRYDFEEHYAAPLEDFDVNDQEFRFKVIREDGAIPITDTIETVEWRDEGNEYNLNSIPVLSGSVTYHRPPDNSHPIRDGHRIRCDVKWIGEWKPLWEMVLTTPPETQVESGAVTAQLSDPLWIAAKSEGYFRYRAAKKKRRRGWLYHEIVQDVCRRYHIPVGPLVKGKKRIKHFAPTGQPISPLEAIRLAVLAEQEWTGRRFVISWRADKKGRFCLHVTNPQRNPVLYQLERQIRATLRARARWSRRPSMSSRRTSSRFGSCRASRTPVSRSCGVATRCASRSPRRASRATRGLCSSPPSFTACPPATTRWSSS